MRNRDVLLLCPAGFQHIVREAVAQDLPSFRDVETSSGYVRCRLSTTIKALAALPYATNALDVIVSVDRSDLRREMSALDAVLSSEPRPAQFPRRGTFRLRVLDDGRFASTTTPESKRLIARLGSWSGLRNEPRGGELELWIVRRRDSHHTILGTKIRRARSQPPAGSLRPEIAAALVRSVPLAEGDTVLDPFAGSGAIGVALLEAGVRRVWLNDMSSDSMTLVAQLPRERSERVHRTHDDFRRLPDADGPMVTAVVTDPPWGLYEERPVPIDVLYAGLAFTMARILDAGRPMVVLTGAPPQAEAALTASGFFSLVERHNVLVNGKKARVLSTRRTGRSDVRTLRQTVDGLAFASDSALM
jgi:predicted RNA methylase